MKKIVLVLTVILLQACVTIPEGYISQEEADRQKHAYFCTTYDLMTQNRSEHLPHCVNRSIDQQQAKALLKWMGNMTGAYIIKARNNPELRQWLPEYFHKTYELVKKLKPYLYEGDYYYYIEDVASDAHRYYTSVDKNSEQAAYWDKVAWKDFYKLEEVGGGLDNHWARPEYSNEKQNKLLVAAAELGNASAQGILGQLYLKGEYGFNKDEKLGIAWIEQSARREANNLNLYELEKLKEYFSAKDYRYWQIMYLLSASKGKATNDDFDGDLLERLVGEVTDWKHFCDKYEKQRWYWPKDDGKVVFEQYQAIQDIILQCVTQYPPAEQLYNPELN